MISFIIGLFVGSFLGVALMALMYMAKDYEPKKREPERKEPTILWTKGNLCKWGGETFEIINLYTTTDNQTEALIERFDERGYWYLETVPAEELEVVE